MSAPVRYSLVQAAKKAKLGHDVLGRMIKAGHVPHAYYVAPEPGGKHGRWVIFAAHFDAWIGQQVEADTEPATEDGAPVSFMKKLA